ncbi:hypothetical protein ACFL2C_02710 [Patescibacteria group bacterium]
MEALIPKNRGKDERIEIPRAPSIPIIKSEIPQIAIRARQSLHDLGEQLRVQGGPMKSSVLQSKKVGKIKEDFTRPTFGRHVAIGGG